MRIAFFHELDFGGARRTVEEFVRRFNKIYDVDLYYVDNKKDINLNKICRNLFYYPFYPKQWKGGNWKLRLYKDTVELAKLYKLHKQIAHDVESKKYDFIIVHPSKFTQAPFVLRFLKNKCIYYCQEPLRIVYDKNLSKLSFVKFHKKIYEFIIRKIRKRIDLKNINSASKVLTNSKFSKTSIMKSYHINAKICYLGVDTNIFKPLNVNKSYDILFIGNKDKTYDLLSDSLKLFKVKPKLHTMFRGNKKTLLDEELVKIYNKSKILVALNQNEPLGLIPLEAMACGTPVIAVNEGGYKESIIDGNTGFLVERNASALSNSISKLLNNDKLRINMSESARKYIKENWTWDKSIKSFLSIIKNAQ